jgi:hypothetical protein
MSTESEPPEPESSSSEPPASPGGGTKESRRRRLEGVIPEIIKRAVEIGVEKARESPDNLKQFVGDMKLPKEIAHYLLQQIDETKNGLFRVVAKEIRDFLEHTNFAGELQKLLTTVQFEVNTTIRFTPNDGRKSKDKDRDRDRDREKDRDEPLSEEAEEGSVEPGDDEERSEARSTLPKPEVRTAVHVRRDDRDRDRPLRRRGSRAP